MSTLREAKIGTTVKVMGITKRCSVFVRKVAPLGDPVEITVRGYELSLRKSEAELIEIDDVTSGQTEAGPVPAAEETKAPETGSEGANDGAIE